MFIWNYAPFECTGTCMYFCMLRHMFLWLCTYLWTPLPQVTDHTSHFSLCKWVGSQTTRPLSWTFNTGPMCSHCTASPRPSFPLIYTQSLWASVPFNGGVLCANQMARPAKRRFWWVYFSWYHNSPYCRLVRMAFMVLDIRSNPFH